MENQCTKCNKIFSTHKFYTNHIEKNVCNRKFECNKCGIQLSTSFRLKQHMENNICNRDTEFKCHRCNKIFSAKVKLQQHLDKKICENKRTSLKQNIQMDLMKSYIDDKDNFLLNNLEIGILLLNKHKDEAETIKLILKRLNKYEKNILREKIDKINPLMTKPVQPFIDLIFSK